MYRIALSILSADFALPGDGVRTVIDAVRTELAGAGFERSAS